MDRYLTVDQTADYLNVSPHTVVLWRSRRNGPPYVVTGLADGAKAPGHAAKQGIRYRQSDLDAWLAERTVRPSESVRPKHLTVVPHVLSDAEWSAVQAAFKSAKLLPSRSDRRAVLNALLFAAATGAWPAQPAGARAWRLQIRGATQGDHWLRVAFEALGKIYRFPATIAVQTILVYRRGRFKHYGKHAWRLRTDTYGALSAVGMGAALDTVLNIPPG